jgi:hypothetical protein
LTLDLFGKKGVKVIMRNKSGYKRPARLRASVFIGGAVLGNCRRPPVLYIAEVAARVT